MQPYGIHLTGDLVGTLIIAGIFFAAGGPRARLACAALAGCSALSAVGSVVVLTHAMGRGDGDVATYHLTWIVTSVTLATWALGRTFAGVGCRVGMHTVAATAIDHTYECSQCGTITARHP